MDGRFSRWLVIFFVLVFILFMASMMCYGLLNGKWMVMF